MNNQFGFALVLLVAIASVASLLFLSGTETTGHVSYQTIECGHVDCGTTLAQPLTDAGGRQVRDDSGKPVCICPRG